MVEIDRSKLRKTEKPNLFDSPIAIAANAQVNKSDNELYRSCMGVYKMTFDTGDSLHSQFVSGRHEAACENEYVHSACNAVNFCTVSSLVDGDGRFQCEDVRDEKVAPDFLCDCHVLSHYDDAHLHLNVKISQDHAQLRSDVHKRIHFLIEDVLGSKQRHILVY